MMRCENPPSTEAAAAKTRELIAPVLGSDLIKLAIWNSLTTSGS
jgi:hypothetical protein